MKLLKKICWGVWATLPRDRTSAIIEQDNRAELDLPANRQYFLSDGNGALRNKTVRAVWFFSFNPSLQGNGTFFMQSLIQSRNQSHQYQKKNSGWHAYLKQIHVESSECYIWDLMRTPNVILLLLNPYGPDSSLVLLPLGAYATQELSVSCQ